MSEKSASVRLEEAALELAREHAEKKWDEAEENMDERFMSQFLREGDDGRVFVCQDIACTLDDDGAAYVQVEFYPAIVDNPLTDIEAREKVQELFSQGTLMRGKPVSEALGSANRAYQRWGHAAEQGDAEAQHQLATAYFYGQRAPFNPHQAARLWRLAAEQGHAEAQYELGSVLWVGDGAQQDHVEAIRWWRKAADQGMSGAQRQLGIAFASGDGVPMDQVAGVSWLQKAADQGDSEAQCALGSCYETGRGVQKSVAIATALWRQAADKGHSLSQAFLGLHAIRGEEGARDHREASLWLALALANWDARVPWVLHGAKDVLHYCQDQLDDAALVAVNEEVERRGRQLVAKAVTLHP